MKSSVRSKLHYDKDIEKSRADSATCSKASYEKDPESGPKSTKISKVYYNKDVKKSRASSAKSSRANYEKDIEASCTRKRQMYVMLFACSLINYVSYHLFEAT